MSSVALIYKKCQSGKWLQITGNGSRGTEIVISDLAFDWLEALETANQRQKEFPLSPGYINHCKPSRRADWLRGSLVRGPHRHTGSCSDRPTRVS